MIHSMTELPTVNSYLQRVGAEPRSLRIAVVKESHGQYWTDVAVIRFSKEGIVDAPDGYGPTEVEAAKIKGEFSAAEWPVSIKLGKGWELPDDLKKVDPEDLFELKDPKGNLIMIHQRVMIKGEKRYVSWSYWSDKQWRRAEPEGPLPLYGLEKLKGHTTVFIHEGGKAARAVHRLVNPKTKEEEEALAAHPWGLELSHAAHIGWIGGALSPSRTDWSMLSDMGIKRAYIVADNDAPGKAATPKIAQRLRGITTMSIEFTDLWPTSFDLADPFPKHMFSKIGKTKFYSGPSFREVLHPATWATDLIPNPGGKGKPIPVLRKEFSDLWVWVEETDTFICKEMPHIQHALAQFNSMVGPFSHVVGTGQLIHKTYKGRTAQICYRPDIDARIVTDRTTSAINLHTPTSIKPVHGDSGPWEEFLTYLFPSEKERHEVKRWCATLIAHPEVRMLYGMLLVSERQGMGKSTLGERILAPLVGLHNTGFPGEREIVESSFNGWAAGKRLIVVGEIYTGQSFKAYNILKTYLTDKNLRVNEKFMRPYTVDNWVHVVACSNSKKALRIEESDRRWFYPELSEVPWKREKWGEFYDWLSCGGLNIIMDWAQNFGDYVMSGEHPPMTFAKAKMIEESRGEALNQWDDILAAVEEDGDRLSFALNEAREAIKKSQGKIYESMLDFKKVAVKRGWYCVPERFGVNGGLSWVVVSPAMADEGREVVGRGEIKELKSWSKGRLVRVADRLADAL